MRQRSLSGVWEQHSLTGHWRGRMERLHPRQLEAERILRVLALGGRSGYRSGPARCERKRGEVWVRADHEDAVVETEISCAESNPSSAQRSIPRFDSFASQSSLARAKYFCGCQFVRSCAFKSVLGAQAPLKMLPTCDSPHALPCGSMKWILYFVQHLMWWAQRSKRRTRSLVREN